MNLLFVCIGLLVFFTFLSVLLLIGEQNKVLLRQNKIIIDTTRQIWEEVINREEKYDGN